MRTRRLTALGLLLTMAVGGCAGVDDDTDVATAGGTTAPSSSATATGPDPDKALKYAQCMRDQGLSWFPDPDPDGGLRVAVPLGTDKEEVDAAAEACKQYAPGGGPTDREPSAEQLEQVQKMAECMRANGVENFPDPGPNGEIQLDRDKLGMGPGDETFDKAQEACKQYQPSDAQQHKETA